MIYALIPAAGKSTRMGRPKLALPLGDRSVLEHVITALRRGGVDRILVVVGPHVPELVPLAERAGADSFVMPAETLDMRATVEAGLRRLEECFAPQAEDGWLLAPADHPTLDAEVVRQLIQVRQAHQAKTILIPTHEGKRGHPTLMSWQHAAGIRQWPSGEGINTYLRAHRQQAVELPLANPRVLQDLDTPEEYLRLSAQWAGESPK